MGEGLRVTVTRLLEATSITKAFAGVQALKGVDFALHSGEVHALIGENGAGKSTLVKIITGALTADSGTLHVNGQAVLHNNPKIARNLGIAAIYQQPSLFPHLSVAENIALSLESGGAWRKVDWKARRARAQELLERAGAPDELTHDPDRLAGKLSMPEQQIVEIAKAIGAEARILIMDEPTASLTSLEVERLFRVIGVLREQGVGIIYISHRLDEIFAIADRITVLRDGEAVGTSRKDEVDRERLIHLMVGRELSAVYPKRTVPLGDVAIEVGEMRVRSGEIVGLAGLVGSGRTELAETIFGLTPADSGEILLRGKPVRISSPAKAIELGIAYVPEDRRQHGVVLEMPIAENISLAGLGKISRNSIIDRTAEHDLAQSYIGQLRIKTSGVDAETAALSGGNQQKVALARWLATNPAVLMLDEPTQGVDIGSKSEIHQLMVDLAERGMAIIMISSELPEILGMSDRIAVMHAGTIRGTLTREEATPQKILALALGRE
jgi:ABC-type sugar transport system ATPase subunit